MKLLDFGYLRLTDRTFEVAEPDSALWLDDAEPSELEVAWRAAWIEQEKQRIRGGATLTQRGRHNNKYIKKKYRGKR